MKSWMTTDLELKPHAPAILSSSDDLRIVSLLIPAGESLDTHQVHEHAFVVVIDGEIEVTTEAGGHASGGRGLLVEFAPNERHAVRAQSDAHLLLLLTPWPGPGHPGAMSVEKKASARSDAAKRKAGA
jgi:quercetin dioxygenase-like cupin family protein